MDTSEIKIPGAINVENYLAAICAVWGDVDVETIRIVARNFGGVEHRAELVRELDGVKGTTIPSERARHARRAAPCPYMTTRSF